MKKYISFFLIALSFSLNTNANNLTISTPIYNDGNKTVTFNVSWDNSWKLSSGPSNWDGVWVFIKRQACSNTNIWATALVSTTSGDHTTSVASGTNLLSVDAVSDGMGVFLRRTFSGMGNIATHTITLKLNGSMTTSPSITPSSADNFRIFGMEMVYVPQGQFYLGDGRQSNSYNFSNGNNAGTPLLITAAIQAAGLGAATNYTSNPMYGCPNYLPASYPTGFNGFWCMKYEATSVSYVDFLNTLTYDQQAVRLSKWGTRYPNSVNTYFGNGGQKGSIYTSVAGTFNTIPATFTYNTSYMNYTPVIYLSWTDLTAYLDWAGLRPMNDFEFEKACRGPLNPIPNEYPWGNTLITQATGTGSNNGTFQERVGQSGEGLCFYSWNDQNWAPYRSGFAATAITTRSQAGATYYGIMEMGGNVSEQVVGGGSGYDYSNFTTANGDGALGADGNANTDGWPRGIGANQGNYCKGGDFNGYGGHPTIIQVSDRQFYGGNTYNNGQSNGTGGRGVRSFQ